MVNTKKHFFSPVIIDAANVQQVEYTQINDILDLQKTDWEKIFDLNKKTFRIGANFLGASE